jgi:hypothetical protein
MMVIVVFIALSEPCLVLQFKRIKVAATQVVAPNDENLLYTIHDES